MYYDLYCEQEYSVTDFAIFKTKKLRNGRIKVVEYINMKTGEILQADQVESNFNIKSIYPEARIRREHKINKLRKETKEFALFILKFRNKSCGFMVPFERLIEWYSKYSGKRVDSVKRSVVNLIKHGILDDNQGIVFLHKDFMINNTERTKNDVKSDPFVAGCIFDVMMNKKKSVEIYTLQTDETQ